ncbi:unnamed protein product [Closterium sp. Naga37s-1]|nr:unnamed protein product [Closterium sp. Naga37s-1]
MDRLDQLACPLDQLACWSSGPIGPAGLLVQWTGWTNWPAGPMDRLDELACWSNGPVGRTGLLVQWTGWTNWPVGPVDKLDELACWYNGPPEYGGEREHGDEQEDGDPQQEGDDLAPPGPHVPSGAVEGERAPSAEHTDTAAAAEEEEGEAREEGARAADSERLERRYAPDPLQQEVRTREGGARTMQSRGMRGRSGAEDRRTTGIPSRRAETRDGSSRSPREPPPRADREESGEEWRRMWFARRHHRAHLEEAVGESIARQRRSGTGRGEGKKDHTHRTSGSSVGQDTEGCRGRPTGAVGEKEGGRKQTARSQAHGSRARAGRNGRQPQRDVSRVKPATGNGSRVIIRRRGDGSGRKGKRVSGASQGRRAESSWRAGPRQAAWRKGLSGHEWPEKA